MLNKSNDTDGNFRNMSTLVTLGLAHPHSVPVIGLAGNGVSTAYANFEVTVPAGALRVDRVVQEWCAGTPNTDAQIRVGLWDHDSTPTLYTSAISTLWETCSNTGSFRQTTFRPGANFTIKPFDPRINPDNYSNDNRGFARMTGTIEIHSPAVSTLYLARPKVVFHMKGQAA
jgi:hypothetical protein